MKEGLKNAFMIGAMVVSWSIYYAVSKVMVSVTGSPYLAGFLLRSAALLFLTAPCPMLQLWVAKALQGVSDWMNATVSGVAGLPHASIEGIHLTLPQLILLYVFLLSTAVWIHRKASVADESRLETSKFLR